MRQEQKKPKNIAKKKLEAITISEEEPTRWRVSSDLLSQPCRPRGKPPGIRKMGHQICPLKQRRLEACIKRRLKDK